jgi:hypothetical protein
MLREIRSSAIQLVLLQFPVAIRQRNQRLDVGQVDVDLGQLGFRLLLQFLRLQDFQFVVARIDLDQGRAFPHKVAGAADVRLEVDAARDFGGDFDLAQRSDHAVRFQRQVARERLDGDRLQLRNLPLGLRLLCLLFPAAHRQHDHHAGSQDQQRQCVANEGVLHVVLSSISGNGRRGGDAGGIRNSTSDATGRTLADRCQRDDRDVVGQIVQRVMGTRARPPAPGSPALLGRPDRTDTGPPH